jgi:hypothetical protein
VHFYKQRFGGEAPPPAPTAAPKAPASANAIQHPLPVPDAAEEPLPSLEQSDPAARDALTKTFGNAALHRSRSFHSQLRCNRR